MRLSGWQVPIEHISASALAMFIQCPEQYRLRKIKKVPESMGLDRFIGIVDHQTHAANFRRKLMSGADLDVEKMNNLYSGYWQETATTEGEPEWATEDENLTTMLHGQLMMQTYHEQVSPTITPIAVEQEFREKLPGIPVPVVGYPDVETKEVLVERKTSANKINKPKQKWSFQGRIYSMVYDKPVAYHIVTKQVTPQIVTPEVSPDLLLVNGHRDSTLRTIQQAAFFMNDCWLRYGPERPWPLHGLLHDWLCNYCFAGPRYGKSCPAWRET